MKPYSSYKDSGEEWIGKIPSGWNPVRNKFLFTIKKTLVGENSSDYKLLSLTKQGIILRDIESGKGKFPEKFDTYQVVEKNNLVFCLFDIDETPRTIGLSTFDGMITGAYTVVQCENGVDPQFIYYKYLSVDNVKGLRPHYTGLRKVVRTETFLGLKVQTPPLPEQQQISNYLDQKTQQIDSLIEKTQQKIELLKEKRTSLINHCVTKGLDPNAEMKDSDVEWIGEIPRGWVVSKIKYILQDSKDSIRTGPFGSQLKSDDMVDEGIRIYNQRTVYDEDFESGSIFVSPEKFESMKSFTVMNGDVLISSRGTIGKMTTVPEGSDIGVLHPCLIRLRTNDDVISKKYLWWYMNHSSLFLESVKLESNATTIDVIYSNVLSEVKFPRPSLQEQQQIVTHLDQETKKIDTLIQKENQRIDLLKEYRQSLISEVVTGKIDVRNEVLQ